MMRGRQGPYIMERTGEPGSSHTNKMEYERQYCCHLPEQGEQHQKGREELPSPKARIHGQVDQIHLCRKHKASDH